MRILPEAIEVAEEITKNIEGRAADMGLALPFIGSMVAAAGDGDHVEIGTLYGASAIAAALIKKKLGLKGKVYCIDPYDKETRDKNVHLSGSGAKGEISATPEEFFENAKRFDVDLTLIQEYSDPWPEKLKDNVFATAYIDGDHTGDAPWRDFENLRGRVTDYIGTDNYEEEYPDVVAAMHKAMNTEDWFLYYKNLTFVALRKIMPYRSDQTQPFSIMAL